MLHARSPVPPREGVWTINVTGRTKVLHLITELSIGGAQTAVLRLLAGMDRDRFSPTVVCLYNGGASVAQQIRKQGTPVIDLGMADWWRWDALGRLFRLLRRDRPTILHTWMFHANILGRIVGRLAGVPIIITARRNAKIGGNTREFLKRVTACLDDRVIAVSDLVRQAEIDRTGAPPEKVETICNGIDVAQLPPNEQARTETRKRFGIPFDAPLIGSVGRLHPQKGYSDLLAALVLVRNRAPATRLLLIGDGKLRSDLEAQAQATGLSESVIIAGTRTEIPEILAAFDLFVLPSVWEGMPNAVLEAMFSELPVVATMVGGTPEVVHDGVTGLLVPPGDPEALAKTIETLLADPDRARAMGRAGRQRVIDHFDIRTTVRRTEALYEELLQEKLGSSLRASQEPPPG